jgi:hypothetical protein
MATAAVSIIDRLIQLATVRERNKERYFRNFIEPLYADGEKIAEDYIGLLTELSHRIGQATDNSEIAEWLEARRASLQPLRVKVRALIQDRFMEHGKDTKGKAVALFQKGLWGLMKGGVSVTEDGHALTWEYGFGDHTVLDLLRRARESSLAPHFREILTRQARLQKEAIERAWDDVTKAYADIKLACLR